MRRLASLLATCLIGALAQTAAAQQVLTKGPETGLPMPRFVSVKATKARVRQGPSRDHRIEWLFVHKDIPVKVTAEHGHWRRIEDSTGAGGWMHYSLLSGRRSALITSTRVALRSEPASTSDTLAFVEQGVIARLGVCENGWCELSVGDYTGWSRSDGLWGVEIQ